MSKSEQRPAELLGLPVHAWTDLRETAATLDVSERSIQRYDGKGLPSHGEGANKRYPWPHLVIWYGCYQVHTDVLREVVDFLPFDVARAEHELFEAQLGAAGELRIRKRP